MGLTAALRPGIAFPPFTHALERVKCVEFATAIGDRLRTLPDGREEAPLGSVLFVAAQDSGTVFRTLGLGWPDVLFGGIDLEYGRALAAGETLEGATVVADCRERGEGERRVGIVQLRTGYRDRSGATALTETSTLIVRPGGVRASPEGPPAPPLPEGAASRAHTVTRMDIAWMAVAITDPNPLHVEEDIARAAGFRSVIAHGTFPIGTIGAAVADVRGAGGVRRLSVRLTAPTYPGDRIVATAAPSTERRDRLDVLAEAGGRLLAKGQVEVEG